MKPLILLNKDWIIKWNLLTYEGYTKVIAHPFAHLPIHPPRGPVHLSVHPFVHLLGKKRTACLIAVADWARVVLQLFAGRKLRISDHARVAVCGDAGV